MRSKQDALEGLPKFRTEDGIDDRVERRVEVAQPEEQGRYRIVDVAGLAQRQQKRRQKKGQPTDDERPGDDGKGFRCLPFPFRL